MMGQLLQGAMRHVSVAKTPEDRETGFRNGPSQQPSGQMSVSGRILLWRPDGRFRGENWNERGSDCCGGAHADWQVPGIASELQRAETWSDCGAGGDPSGR